MTFYGSLDIFICEYNSKDQIFVYRMIHFEILFLTKISFFYYVIDKNILDF